MKKKNKLQDLSREIIDENDIYVNALRKCNIMEDAIPEENGMIIGEDNLEAYGKIQKMLNCVKMEKAHKFLYSLDPDELSDEELEKIDRLYSLGKKSGFFDDTPESFEDVEEEPEDNEESPESKEEEPKEDKEKPKEESEEFNNLGSSECNCQQPTCSCSSKESIKRTFVFSATKNGEIRTGESWSTAPTCEEAKQEVLQKLKTAGYENVSILAVETSYSYQDEKSCEDIDDFGDEDIPDDVDISDEDFSDDYGDSCGCDSDDDYIWNEDDDSENPKKKEPEEEEPEEEPDDSNEESDEDTDEDSEKVDAESYEDEGNEDLKEFSLDDDSEGDEGEEEKEEPKKSKKDSDEEEEEPKKEKKEKEEDKDSKSSKKEKSSD